MNTTTAAAQAKVTVATIRTWCRRGVIAATKTAGKWVIDTASLARRIEIGARRMAELTTETLSPKILQGIRRARYEYTTRNADRPALAGRYVLPGLLPGVAVWREKGLVDDIQVNGRSYYVLSDRAVQVRAGL
ncbi:helix-turn-helix domain-containing protein [Streptomyces lydicus]|uniref:helix-turn-helix domain-containing protein n=1 Tax=Streptomyces lydicus TaxID=47763 RepID=UPI0037AFE931